MDQLDVNLLDAWNRIGARVREDRIEALRRAKRHFTNALRRPMRAWCLCIRASDTRISAWNAIIDPLPEPSDDGTSFIGNWSDVEEARRSTDDGWHPGVADDVSELVTRGLPHVVTLSGKVIRELTRPVRIPWPGEDWKVAAAKLGRHHYTLRGWMRHGVLQTRREYSRPHGYRGKPLPIVWSPTPLDPNAHEGRAPDPIWGTLWQWMWEQLPEDYSLTAVRVPSVRKWKGQSVQRGWSFICPGRLRAIPAGSESGDQAERAYPHPVPSRNGSDDRTCFPGNMSQAQALHASPARNDGCRDRTCFPGNMSYEHVPCGRRVGRLYGPQSVWTLGQALDVQEGFDLGAADPDRVTGLEPARFLPNDGETSAPDLAGPWFPGLVDPVKATGPRSFACHYCWRVRYTSLLDRHGWNDFVTHISGGLLYGREVPRPLEHAQPQRKRRYSKQKAPRATPGRDAVLELLRAGLDDREIAQRRGITRGSVRRHMRALCKMQGVQSRQELNDRLNAAADGLKPVCRIELGVCTSARQERLPHSACTAHGA